jgi:hypothetical protein
VSNVEFLSDGAADAPEPPPRRRRPFWWGLAAVALAAAAVVWVLTRPSPPAAPPVAQPNRVPVPTASVSRDVCNGAAFCAVSLLIPQPLRAAVRHYLPTAQELRVHSHVAQTATSGAAYLAAREIEIRTPSATVLIAVHRLFTPVSRASAIVDAPLGFGSAVVHRQTGAFDIDVQYVAPETVPPTLSILRVLARDPRLESF